jgi:ATP-dependent DNA helicase PIF1
MVLGKDTEQVIDLIVRQKKSVEMIGQAGTGKTFTLKRLAYAMSNKYMNFAMTASTGRAALNVGGQTIHSFAGTGIGDEEEHVYIQKVTRSPWYRKVWNRPKVLVIEEISMMGLKYFELVDRVARAARKCDKPFGGLQLLVCGDFMQLPPVNAEYVFKSKVYKELFGKHTNTVLFKDIKRQTCPKLIKILQEARTGVLSQESIALLTACVNKPIPEDLPVDPMILFARRADVRGYNLAELEKLDGAEKMFNYAWQPSPSISDKENEMIRRNLERNVQAPVRLSLKIGAQVMLVRNMPKLCPPKFNGSMGIVTGYFKDTPHPVVKFVDGSEITIMPAEWWGPKKKGCYIQYPLILAWALTVHKAQVCLQIVSPSCCSLFPITFVLCCRVGRNHRLRAHRSRKPVQPVQPGLHSPLPRPHPGRPVPGQFRPRRGSGRPRRSGLPHGDRRVHGNTGFQKAQEMRGVFWTASSNYGEEEKTHVK